MKNLVRPLVKNLMKPLVKNLSDQHGSYLVKKLQAACRMWLERQTGIPQRILGAPDVLRTAEMRARMGLDALTLYDAPEQVVIWLMRPERRPSASVTGCGRGSKHWGTGAATD